MLLQITYQLPAVQVGMRIAVRGDTYASHVNFMNQVMLKAGNTAAQKCSDKSPIRATSIRLDPLCLLRMQECGVVAYYWT